MPQPSPDFSDRTLEATFDEVLASLPDTIVQLDLERRILRVNRPESPVFTRVVAPGDSIADVLDPAARALVHDMIVNAEMTGGALAEHRSGSDLYRITARPLVSAPMLLVVFKNITGIRNAGQTIVDLVRDRSDFLAAVSDELRTPLTAVVGYANLLAEPRSMLDDDTRVEMVRDMTDQAWDLAGIVEDLLTVANAELGALWMAKVRVNVGANVAQVIESMGGRGDAIRVSEEQAVIAIGDPARYRQIVRNLLTNALRHGTGPVSVSIMGESGKAVLEVRDHGPGIPDSLAALIVGDGSDARSPAPGSVGLGLWIARELARLMGGTLTYERPDDTTVFKVVMPML